MWEDGLKTRKNTKKALKNSFFSGRNLQVAVWALITPFQGFLKIN